ncbi:MAG: hypothetical protein U0K81_06505 [Paludibacteraceae bacterium]|nr:hypothetical protein [Paludibacteraceae bacterium]
MKFNSQICTTKEQSERLLTLGLKKETADMCIRTDLGFPLTTPYNEVDKFYHKVVIPAWSLHRLIEMIPDKIAYPTIYDSAPLRINKDSMYYLYRFFDKYGDEDFSTVGDDEAIGSHNVYDYAVSVIGFIIKGGYFNKEYLEE